MKRLHAIQNTFDRHGGGLMIQYQILELSFPENITNPGTRDHQLKNLTDCWKFWKACKTSFGNKISYVFVYDADADQL